MKDSRKKLIVLSFITDKGGRRMKRDPSSEQNHKDRYLQLEQKLLRYKSEIAHYQAKVKEYEQQLKKEHTRIQYLQSKLAEAQTKNIDNYEKKISALEHKVMQMEVELEEEKNQANTILKKAVAEAKQEKEEVNPSFMSYFSHSTILPSKDEQQVSIIGEYQLKNTGNVPLHDIIICLKVSPKEAGKLSGEIVMHKRKEPLHYEDTPFLQWAFIHENWMDKIKETGEYWLKPLGIDSLKPNESISFSQFDAKLDKPAEKNAVILDGFIYCKEIPKGQRALNNIVINF